MNEQKIARINELWKKKKSIGLTPEEETEQAALRKEYLESVKANIKAQLDNIEIVDEETVEKYKAVHKHDHVHGDDCPHCKAQKNHGNS